MSKRRTMGADSFVLFASILCVAKLKTFETLQERNIILAVDSLVIYIKFTLLDDLLPVCGRGDEDRVVQVFVFVPAFELEHKLVFEVWTVLAEVILIFNDFHQIRSRNFGGDSFKDDHWFQFLGEFG